MKRNSYRLCRNFSRQLSLLPVISTLYSDRILFLIIWHAESFLEATSTDFIYPSEGAQWIKVGLKTAENHQEKKQNPQFQSRKKAEVRVLIPTSSYNLKPLKDHREYIANRKSRLKMHGRNYQFRCQVRPCPTKSYRFNILQFWHNSCSIYAQSPIPNPDPGYSGGREPLARCAEERR